MSRWISVPMILVACAVLVGGTKEGKLPRLPGAVLLTGHLPELFITTPDETLDLRVGRDDSIGRPTMSLNGAVVAGYRSPSSGGVSTFSVRSREWTDYRMVPGAGGALAVSPDGSKLAFIVREGVGAPYRLYVIDLNTGTETVGPNLGADHWGRSFAMSWSPDGRRIAFDRDVNRSPANTVPMIPTTRPAIHVLELETGKITKIADGRGPAWSPSGEWIAYLNYSPERENPGLGSSLPNANQACVIHPDGTGFKVLATLRGDNLFVPAPVWSPDSKTVLLNKVRDWDKFTMDIYLLDLATLKMTRKFKDVPPVFGWAAVK